MGGGSVRRREKTPISGSAPFQQLLGQRSKEVGWGLPHLGLRMTWSSTVRKQAWTQLRVNCLHIVFSVSPRKQWGVTGDSRQSRSYQAFPQFGEP